MLDCSVNVEAVPSPEYTVVTTAAERSVDISSTTGAITIAEAQSSNAGKYLCGASNQLDALTLAPRYMLYVGSK